MADVQINGLDGAQTDQPSRLRRKLIAALAFAAVIVVAASAFAIRRAGSGDVDTHAELPSLVRLATGADERWTIETDGHLGSAVATDNVIALIDYTEGVPWSIVALDRPDGGEQWRITAETADDRALVKLARVEGVVVANVTLLDGRREWIGFDPETGAQRWRFVGGPDEEFTYYESTSGLLQSLNGSDSPLQLLSPIDGHVIGSVGSGVDEALGLDGDRIAFRNGTTVEILSYPSLRQVAGPVDLGVIVSEVAESGDVLMALDGSGERLYAFDRDGAELASLELGRAAESLTDVPAETPTVLVSGSSESAVIELDGDELRTVETIDGPLGTIWTTDGGAWRVIEPGNGATDIVSLVSGETVMSFSTPVRRFANGVVVGERLADDRLIVEAFSSGGTRLWSITVPAPDGMLENPQFVDDGIITLTLTPDGTSIVTLRS